MINAECSKTMKTTGAKSIAVIFLIGLCLTLWTGCWGKASDEAEQIVVAFMEKRYSEKFSPAGTYVENTNKLEMYVTCESMPEAKIHVYAENWRDPDCVITDNYLIYKHWDDILCYVQDVVNRHIGTAIIHAEITGQTLSAQLPAQATLEQILQDPGALLHVRVDIPESAYEGPGPIKTIMEELRHDVTEYNILFVVLEDDLHGTLTSNELVQRYNSEDIICGAYFYRYNGESYEYWKNPSAE